MKKIIFLCLFLGLMLFNPVLATDNFDGYMNVVRSKIQKNWYPPECLERDAHMLVQFSITRSGDIISTKILESSGDSFYDASALEALENAAPFGNFPAQDSRGSLTINYSFDTSVVSTADMQRYIDLADKYYNVDNKAALGYITKAIDEVDGDINAYFLYGKRGKIRRALGDHEGALEDLEESKRLKAKYDKKRIMRTKLFVEMEQSPFSYFALAHSYDIAGDYDNAVKAIEKAINMTDLNNQYKRYRVELMQKRESV